MREGSKDVLSGTILFVFSIAMFWNASHIERILPIGVGSGFMPEIVAAMLTLVSAVIVFNGVKANRRGGTAGGFLQRDQLPVVAATFVLIGAYVACLEVAGFLVSTFVYLTLQFAVLAPRGERNWVRFAVVGAVATVGIYYAFVELFDLILPVGILG